MSSAVLLITCPDRTGIVAAVSEFVFRHGGNILHAEQHAQDEMFFQRVEFDLDGLTLSRDEIDSAFAHVADPFGMHYELRFTDDIQRMAILVSHQAHCLYDLLARWRIGELRVEIPLVISNHDDHADVARAFDVAFHHLPADPTSRPDQEQMILDLLEAEQIDVVVLARYMQVLSDTFTAAYANRVINIHHSFLPAFVGAKPYHQAHERGVKIIGATAHYATSELDQGPIIEQDVARVSHRHNIDDLVRTGRDLEKIVLARAVRLHLEHRILVHANKTVIFS
jgi:formyltetrahydrofolate deformylase